MTKPTIGTQMIRSLRRFVDSLSAGNRVEDVARVTHYFTYRGHVGRAVSEPGNPRKGYHGEIEGIAGVTFQGRTVAEARDGFRESVDRYLVAKSERGLVEGGKR